MRTLLLVIILVQVLKGCIESDISVPNNEDVSNYWLIPKDEVSNNDFRNKDHIVSIDKPVFVKVNKVDFLEESDLVFALKENNIVKIYPLSIMAGHEIVNDSIGNLYFVVSYCPQTKSAICFNRKIRGEVTEFGVSGMLYNDNLMPYDRNTESIWSQMLGKCVNGKLVTEEFKPIMMIAANWDMMKKSFPNALVLIENDLKRNKSSENFLNEGAYFGVIKRFDVDLYSYKSLKDLWTIIEGQEMVIGNNLYNYISAFKRTGAVGYRAVSDSLPIILADGKGNKIDAFGYILEGPDKNQRLETINTYSALFWAWESFYEIGNINEF